MNPLKDFTLNLLNNKVDKHYYPRVILYYFKFALFEPFRVLERVLFSRQLKNYKFNHSPIFILGYYRSGTTHLQEVLLNDKRFGYLNFYQCFFSSAFNTTEKVFKNFCNIIVRVIGFKHPAHNIPFHFNMPAEEDVALVSSGYILASNWGQLFPQNFKKFFNKTVFFEDISEKEKKDFEFEMLDLIKRISIANSSKQLLLKSPPQTARVKLLLKLFPRAKFIYIYRNPFEVIKSNRRLWKSFEGQHLSKPSAEQIDECIFWSFNKCLEQFEQDKILLNSNQIIEIRFEDFQKDPLRELKRIYESFGLDDFDKSKFSSYIAKNHGKNRVQYNWSDQEVDTIYKKCKKWIEYGNYESPILNDEKR